MPTHQGTKAENKLRSIFFSIVFSIEIAFAFGQEMNSTGCPEFAVNFRIAAFEAVFTHMRVKFQAGVAGFPVRVIKATSPFSHHN